MKRESTALVLVAVALLAGGQAAAQHSAFTYQGRLADGGVAANGSYDLQLKLFDAATTPPGVQVGSTVSKENVPVTEGLFAVQLDFSGATSTSDALWLEIGARPGSSGGSFTVLTPRQPLDPAPSAHYSRSGVATDVQCAGCVGVDDLAGGAATSGQVLTATGATTMDWQSPAGPSGSGTTGQVAFWSGSSALSGSASLLWNNTSGTLTADDLALPATSSTAGYLALGINRFLHAYGSEDTFLGVNAGNTSLTGWGNTGIGFHALSENAAATGNTAVGAESLQHNTFAQGNTAIGFRTLSFQSYDNGSVAWNTNNTAVGHRALNVNQPTSSTNGRSNTAVGANALGDNTIGSLNTAVGDVALFSNTTASNNTALGTSALYMQSFDNAGADWSSSNTAVGYQALYHNQPTSTTTGRRNTAVGAYAGDGYTGSNNTFLGNDTDATAEGLSNAMALGSGATVNASNKVRIGNSSVTVIEGQVDWSFPSDVRHKKDISELDLGLDFVLRLRPVQYRLKDGNERLDMGFIAQDIEALLGDGYNLLGIGEDADRTLSLRRGDLIAPLVKAVQEQQAELAAQRAALEERDRRIDRLESSMAELADRVAAVTGTPVAPPR